MEFPTTNCVSTFANRVFAKAAATGSKIEAPKVVFNDWIKENNAILSFPSNRK
jgi:hypothetical protein